MARPRKAGPTSMNAQAYRPRIGAWENLKQSLRVEFEDLVWDPLAGTTSVTIPAGEHG